MVQFVLSLSSYFTCNAVINLSRLHVNFDLCRCYGRKAEILSILFHSGSFNTASNVNNKLMSVKFVCKYLRAIYCAVMLLILLEVCHLKCMQDLFFVNAESQFSPRKLASLLGMFLQFLGP